MMLVTAFRAADSFGRHDLGIGPLTFWTITRRALPDGSEATLRPGVGLILLYGLALGAALGPVWMRNREG